MLEKLVDKLVEECPEDVEEAKITGIALFECNSAENKNKCKSSCTIYVVLIVIVFTLHWNWYLFCLLQIHESLVLKKCTCTQQQCIELINRTSQINKY